MRNIKFKEIEEKGLNQNRLPNYITILDKENSTVGPTNLMCKDYFQTIFAYITDPELYAKNTKSIYGLDIKENFQSLIGYENVSLFFRPLEKGRKFVSFEDAKRNIEVFKEWLLINNAQDEFINGFSIEETDREGVVLNINIDVFRYSHRISLLLLYTRACLFIKDLDLYAEDSNSITFREPMTILNLTHHRRIKNYLVLLETYKEQYSARAYMDRVFNFKDLDNFQCSSGIIGSINSYFYIPDGYSIATVYGTLRQGHGNHRVFLEGQSTFLGETRFNTSSLFKERTYPTSFVSLGSFPGLVIHEYTKYSDYTKILDKYDTVSSIVVENYLVDNKVMLGLDKLEGYNKSNPKSGLYDKIEYAPKHFIYVYNGNADGRTPITNGDYTQFIKERNEVYKKKATN